MAARAIVKRIYVNPRALSMHRIFLSPGTIHIRSFSDKVKASDTVVAVKPSFSVDETKTTKDRGVDVYNQAKVVFRDEAWKLQTFEAIEETGLKLLQLLQERDEVEMIRNPTDKFINYMKPIRNLWIKKFEEEDTKLLQEGWTWLRDALAGTGLLKFHERLLLSIQHYHGLEGEEILKFATASPQKGLVSARILPLQRPGPYKLPRQVVMDVVLITTKDAFLLCNPTTGNRSPWIETTTTQKGKARRQVESIALGFDWCRKQHKVICISSFVKKTSPESEYLVVEVLDVRDATWATGECQWRKLKCVPPAIQGGDRFVLIDGPLYMDGKIHWHFHYDRSSASILEFNVFTESFIITPIAEFVIQEFMESSKHIRSMLMEVDGKLAILKSTSDQETSSLCICHSSRRSDSKEVCKIEWTEEEIPIPYTYYACPGFSVEALRKTGAIKTDVMFIQSHHRLSYYNRKTKAILSTRIPDSPFRDHFDWGRMIQL